MARTLAALARHGLLLTQDASFPNVVELVAGETVRGSWWSHPRGREIFAALTELADHEDVLHTKLLFGKDTFVHRSLWPALLAVGASKEPWQLKGLSSRSKQMLDTVERRRTPVRATGPTTKPLLLRLLVSGREVHTESGAHAMEIESWRAWSKRSGCRAAASAAAGRRTLEEKVEKLGGPLDALPWNGILSGVARRRPP